MQAEYSWLHDGLQILSMCEQRTALCQRRENGLALCMQVALCSLRMSYVYKLQSSFATVKLKASMGFQAMLLLLVCNKVDKEFFRHPRALMCQLTIPPTHLPNVWVEPTPAWHMPIWKPLLRCQVGEED